CPRSSQRELLGNRGRELAHYLLDVSVSNQPGGFVELTAQPAHDRRGVGQLAVFDQLDHAELASGALLGFQQAVFMSRQLHIDPTLFSANAPCTHVSMSLRGLTNFGKNLNRNR